MQEIPIKEPGPDFSISVPLSGVVYLLRFKWNMRSGWYFALSDANSTRILSARRLVPDWPLLRLCLDERRPAGELYLLDTTGAAEYPARNELGSRHRLVYVE